jgi:hypothetical protein
MKLFFKIIFGLIVLILLYFAFSLFNQPKYVEIPIGPEALSKSDIITLKNKGFLSDSEKVVLFYSLKNIKETGCLLTDKKILSYDPGQNLLTAESAPFDSIQNITMQPSTNIFKYSSIDILRVDSTKFSLVIVHTSKCDDKFYNMLTKKWKQHRSNKESK